MKNYPYLLLLPLLLFSACHKSTDNPPDEPSGWVNPLTGLPDEGNIRWDGLKTGQRSKYLYFEARYDPFSGDTLRYYYPDTLVLAVSGQDAQGFVLKEFVLSGAVSQYNPQRPNDTTVYAYHINLTTDSVKFAINPPGFSPVFNNVHALPIAPFAAPVPEYAAAEPAYGYRTDVWMAFIQQHTHLGSNFGLLNLVYNYEEMSTDGAGYLFAYSRTEGLVRFSWVSYWDSNLAKGFDLLAD